MGSPDRQTGITFRPDENGMPHLDQYSGPVNARMVEKELEAQGYDCDGQTVKRVLGEYRASDPVDKILDLRTPSPAVSVAKLVGETYLAVHAGAEAIEAANNAIKIRSEEIALRQKGNSFGLENIAEGALNNLSNKERRRLEVFVKELGYDLTDLSNTNLVALYEALQTRDGAIAMSAKAAVALVETEALKQENAALREKLEVMRDHGLTRLNSILAGVVAAPLSVITAIPKGVSQALATNPTIGFVSGAAMTGAGIIMGSKLASFLLSSEFSGILKMSSEFFSKGGIYLGATALLIGTGFLTFGKSIDNLRKPKLNHYPVDTSTIESSY